jgi:uncharacterized membrane protein YhaH (DUF805 family)
MASADENIRPGAKWAAIALSVFWAAYCVYLLVAIGTPLANILAIGIGGFPLAAWWEAKRLHDRGKPEAAEVLVITTAIALMMLALLATYTAELAERSAGCPPQ